MLQVVFIDKRTNDIPLCHKTSRIQRQRCSLWFCAASLFLRRSSVRGHVGASLLPISIYYIIGALPIGSMIDHCPASRRVSTISKTAVHNGQSNSRVLGEQSRLWLRDRSCRYQAAARYGVRPCLLFASTLIFPGSSEIWPIVGQLPFQISSTAATEADICTLLVIVCNRDGFLKGGARMLMFKPIKSEN